MEREIYLSGVSSVLMASFKADTTFWVSTEKQQNSALLLISVFTFCEKMLLKGKERNI